ncbi:MAG: hypothetical protein IPK25_08270 [Saprospiraceae bacterium]|nr:hypothetical protein [Saprospiraceae bacterium]
MFKFHFKIDGVLKYSILGKDLFISMRQHGRSGKMQIWDLINVILKKEIESNTFYYTLFSKTNNEFLLVNNESNGSILDLDYNLKMSIDKEIKITYSESYADLISVYQGTLENRKFGIYSIPDKRMLFISENLKSLQVIDKNIFGQDNWKLYRVNCQSGEMVWKKDLRSIYTNLINKQGRIKLFGIKKDVVLVGLQSIDKILELNLDTGEVVWEIDTFTSGILVDSFEDVLHQMMVNYAAYDTISGNLIRNFNNSEYFKSNGIESQRDNYYCFSPHIFTTDWRNGNIGAFNTESQKFDWVYKIEGVSFPEQARWCTHTPI